MQREHSKSEMLSSSPRYGWLHFAASVPSSLAGGKRIEGKKRPPPIFILRINLCFLRYMESVQAWCKH